MIAYNVRNVNHAFALEVNNIKQQGVPRTSRAGDVIEFCEPVATTYSNPMERVLYDSKRMCNPFFHFFEGLWIIAGRRDVEGVEYFNSGMRQYSDDGVSFYGAYGYRLRHECKMDQLAIAIAKLKANPDDRRIVVSMWKPDLDIQGGKLDHPCNTHIYFKVRDGELYMTVCCRSNDLLWGKLGANVVHFSMLQEYMAAMIGVGVGPYTQMSDSLHVYVDTQVWKNVKDSTSYAPDDPYTAEYPEFMVKPYRMFKNADKDDWHKDLNKYMLDPFDEVQYKTPFFEEVAKPIAIVWMEHKEHCAGRLHVDKIKASDWRLACKQWLSIKEMSCK